MTMPLVPEHDQANVNSIRDLRKDWNSEKKKSGRHTQAQIFRHARTCKFLAHFISFNKLRQVLLLTYCNNL